MSLMDASALIGNAQDAYSLGLQNRVSAQTSAKQDPANPQNQKNVREAAESFESFFAGQMLEYMWQGVEVDSEFGGGHAEEMWRSMLNQEYGKHIAKNGGLGIASNVMASMLKAQEERTTTDQAASKSADGVKDDASTAGAIASAAALRR